MSEFGNGIAVAIEALQGDLSISSMSSGAPPQKPRGLVE
jgi:hypothetical protein